MKSFGVIVYLAMFGLACCNSIPTLKGRIIGGRNATIKEFPYQVSVRVDDKHICGGIIISIDTILTAAHCTDGQNEGSLSIRHGSSYADSGIRHYVKKVIQDPDFNSDYNENDASLLKIEGKITFTSSSQPAKLANKRSADGAEAVIAGWGVHYENQDTDDLGTKRLQAVTVNVVNQQTCQKEYNTLRINDKLMCAAAKGKDSCQGDSGGGLMDKKTHQIIGISSWGRKCAQEQFPGVYASIPNLMSFINETNFS